MSLMIIIIIIIKYSDSQISNYNKKLDKQFALKFLLEKKIKKCTPYILKFWRKK